LAQEPQQVMLRSMRASAAAVEVTTIAAKGNTFR
jgi:hypothetical protein